jgi:hypothetical protein
MEAFLNLNSRLNILNIWVDPVNKEECIRKVKSFLKWRDRPKGDLQKLK